jgi:hypothetical protein
MHIASLRAIKELAFSIVHIIVERNLGFEAEHMQRALHGEENVIFYRDAQAGRTGVLTTENVKLGAMTLTNIMLRESRAHLAPERTLVSQVYYFRFDKKRKGPDTRHSNIIGSTGRKTQASRTARDLFLSVQDP